MKSALEDSLKVILDYYGSEEKDREKINTGGWIKICDEQVKEIKNQRISMVFKNKQISNNL